MENTLPAAMTAKKPIARHDDLIYDVGMHQGEDTAFYLKKGFRVVGFEADPDLVEEDQAAFSDAIAQGRLVIVAGAIVRDPATPRVSFYKNRTRSFWGTADSSWARRNQELGTRTEALEVDAVDFSVCIEEHGLPYYMKIDIEGSDLVCLGCLGEFATVPRYLSIESDKRSFQNVVKEIALLESLGYDRFMARQQANIPGTTAPTPSQEGMDVVHVFPPDASGPFGEDLPGRWMAASDIIQKYREIFRSYRRFGDHTLWQRHPLSRKTLNLVSAVIGRPLPGWYDTHARHASWDDPI